ncbi:helix-turn-helix domain-containing protein [Paenibacillus aurantiacus]|uniref:Helix-turn-helix domain-containing protein n=1 Tax=Paenibacillus aurantiacus TaxID=1936118 RepID=A0ABV5KN47_9BACL
MKSRWGRLQPSEAGVQPLPGRRRTPGLRREEVSYLAHISVTYYTWLEQGKEVNPSPEVLLSISKALQLDEDEQKHLFDLANVDATSAVTATNSGGPDTGILQRIVDQLHYPSFITDEGTDVIVWNRAAELIVADFGSLPDHERNMMNIMFLASDYRSRLVNCIRYRHGGAIIAFTGAGQARPITASLKSHPWRDGYCNDEYGRIATYADYEFDLELP